MNKQILADFNRVNSIGNFSYSAIGKSPIASTENVISVETMELQRKFSFAPTEEKYFGSMTNEQKLLVTYISLLILQQRAPFALRAIYLID